MKAAGNQKFEVFPIPYARKYANVEPPTMTMPEYLTYLDDRTRGDPSKELNYIFEMFLTDDAALKFVHTIPSLLAGNVNISGYTQFSLGGVLMGANIHYHKRAFNSLFHGRKLWFLKPRASGGWGNDPPYIHLTRNPGGPYYAGAYRCVQEAGDLLYVPPFWSHSTVCLSDCIGTAFEVGQGPDDLSRCFNDTAQSSLKFWKASGASPLR